MVVDILYTAYLETSQRSSAVVECLGRSKVTDMTTQIRKYTTDTTRKFNNVILLSVDAFSAADMEKNKIKIRRE